MFKISEIHVKALKYLNMYVRVCVRLCVHVCVCVCVHKNWCSIYVLKKQKTNGDRFQ